MAQDVVTAESAKPLKTSSQQGRLTLFAEVEGERNSIRAPRSRILELGTETEIRSALRWMLQTDRPCPLDRLITHLRALAVTHPMQELNEAEASLKFRIFCEDLGHIPERIIVEACKSYRRDPENRFFPTPGQMLAICEPAMKARDLQHTGAKRMLQTLSEAEQEPPAPERRMVYLPRPSGWFIRPKSEWREDWLEREVPEGYQIRDTAKSKLREPIRA